MFVDYLEPLNAEWMKDIALLFPAHSVEHTHQGLLERVRVRVTAELAADLPPRVRAKYEWLVSYYNLVAPEYGMSPIT